MRIWAKLMTGDKIVSDVMLSDISPHMCIDEFQSAVQEIAGHMDISTPIILSSYLKHFNKFSRMKFLPRDFVEDVDFTCLILEGCD